MHHHAEFATFQSEFELMAFVNKKKQEKFQTDVSRTLGIQCSPWCVW